MLYRYSSIAGMMLFISASSFAASATLPPLPDQQPLPALQDSAKPPTTPPSSSSTAPASSPASLTPEKQNPVEPPPDAQVLPQAQVTPADQAGDASTPASTQATTPPTSAAPAVQVVPAAPPAALPTAPPASSVSVPTPSSDVKKPPVGSKDDHEDSDSFIDTGQKKLPRVGKIGDQSADSSGYNPSDLRIPVIESAEKDSAEAAKSNSAQASPQISSNAAGSAPDAALVQAATAGAAHTEPDISLPEASHPQQAADSAAVIPSASAQTAPLQVPSPAPVDPSKAAAATPAVSASPATPAPTVSAAPPAQADTQHAVFAQSIDAASPAMAHNPEQAYHETRAEAPASAVADAAPILLPPPVPPAPAPAPPPPPPHATDAQQPQAAASDAAATSSADAPTPVQASATAPSLAATAQVAPLPSHESAAPVSLPEKQLTADQIKFISDEAAVFILADDEVELGELTKEARISQMPAYNYIKLFWNSYKTPLDKMHKQDVDLFLAMLETYPSAAYADAMSNEDASNQAFDAATSGKLSDLRAIISYYPVLQMRDARGNNMLVSVIESDRLEVAKFLLVRGIDFHATNYEGRDAFAIAQDENNDEAADLLTRAGFFGRR